MIIWDVKESLTRRKHSDFFRTNLFFVLFSQKTYILHRNNSPIPNLWDKIKNEKETINLNIDFSKNIKLKTGIAIVLTLTMTVSLLLLPATAQTRPWGGRVPTWTFAVVSPNPVGVGQEISIVYYNPQVPPESLATNDIRWYGYTLKITKPDGTVQNFGPFTSDATGTQYLLYTPDQVGNYTVFVQYPEQTYRWNDTDAQRTFYGLTFLASNYTTIFTVQQEPVKNLYWELPLPTEYWRRPIDSMNTEWYRISSNWLGNAKDRNNGYANSKFQEDGIAPNSPHILWTRQLEDGGVVGGTGYEKNGNEFYSGTQYNMRVEDPIAMGGRLYYQLPRGNAGVGGGWIAVDLQTGQQIWYNNKIGVPGSGIPSLQFGYYQAVETMNQHGVVPNGLLFSNNFGYGIDARTGENVINVTGVPTGPEVIGPSGEVIRYTINNAGTTSNPSWRLLQWNSTAVLMGNNLRARDYGVTLNGTSMTPNPIFPAPFFDWNVSIPWLTEIGRAHV